MSSRSIESNEKGYQRSQWHILYSTVKEIVKVKQNEMIGWHHRLDGRESEQAPGVCDDQGGLVCYSPWGCGVLDVTKRLN